MRNPVVHFEVVGPDGPALERFYAELFGWGVSSMPEMQYATVDTRAGTGINGGIGTSPDGSARVTFYVGVADPQATLDRADSLGGSTLMPVTEIPGIVTLAMFADPQGNLTGLVKADPHMPATGPSSGDGIGVTWFEALAPDGDALRQFYCDLFGWTVKDVGAAGGFVYFEVEGAGIGGGIGGTPDGKPHTNVYARVTDAQSLLDQAESLGGKTVMPPSKMDPNLVIAQFADPQGNVFGLYEQA